MSLKSPKPGDKSVGHCCPKCGELVREGIECPREHHTGSCKECLDESGYTKEHSKEEVDTSDDKESVCAKIKKIVQASVTELNESLNKLRGSDVGQTNILNSLEEMKKEVKEKQKTLETLLKQMQSKWDSNEYFASYTNELNSIRQMFSSLTQKVDKLGKNVENQKLSEEQVNQIYKNMDEIIQSIEAIKEAISKTNNNIGELANRVADVLNQNNKIIERNIRRYFILALFVTVPLAIIVFLVCCGLTGGYDLIMKKSKADKVLASSKDLRSSGDEDSKIIIIQGTSRLEKDECLSLLDFGAVVIDSRSLARPEDCKLGEEGEYKHVPIFRVDTANPQPVSFPDTLFKARYTIPILLYSTKKENITIGDKTLEISGNGFELQTVRLGAGRYPVGGMTIKVVEWNGSKGCGISKDAEEGSVDLRIPYGAEVIGERQYFGNKALKSVYIPPTVKVIGREAFRHCSNLTAVTLNGVQEIGNRAFQYSGLTEVMIPGSVDKIGGRSFNRCKSLMSVEMGEGILSIGNYAFSFSPLTSIHIPSSVKHIGGNPFSNIPFLTIITSSNPRFKMENGVLIDVEGGRLIICVSKKKTRVIQEGIKVIGGYAFNMCKELKSVTISNTVEKIGERAFESTGLTHVMIPASVKEISDRAFSNCESLETVVLNEGLESIGKAAFQFTPLKTLTIPSTVISIEGNPFNGCKYLVLRSGNEKFVMTERGELVDMEEDRLITYFSSNAAGEYVAPSYVKTTGYWAAANNCHLKTVILHEDVEDVGDSAFIGCSNLTTFIIPEGVRRISGKEIFKDSSRLTSLEIPHSLWNNGDIGPKTLVGSSIASICYVIHSEEEKEQLQGKVVGGKEMETITFKLAM